MKPSRRLLVRTIGTLYALMVLHTAASRAFVEERDDGSFVPRRTSVEQLAALRDFDEIHVEADFSVEVVQQADYSVEIIGAVENRGDVLARVEGDSLWLYGYGSPDGVRVRIGLPELQDLSTDFSPLLSVSGFRGDALGIRVGTRPGRIQRLELRDLDIEDLQIRVLDNTSSVDVQLDQATFANGLDIRGSARVTIAE